MFDEFAFFLQLLSNGILIGLMYTLVALGFVLVYKATDAVNFAQGEFVMIAGIVVAGALSAWVTGRWARASEGAAAASAATRTGRYTARAMGALQGSDRPHRPSAAMGEDVMLENR